MTSLPVRSDNQQAGEAEKRRRRVVAEIRRTRLGGPERITVDEPGDPPPKRYAQIYENGRAMNLIYADGPCDVEPCYRGWKLVGVIDLDTGDVAARESSQ